MNWTLIISITLTVLMICIVLFLINENVLEDKNQDEDKDKALHQGPVPEGYDEDYFRNTGITRKLGEGNE